MANDIPQLTEHRSRPKPGVAVVFVHGFSGGGGTWGNFPELVAADPSLDGFGVYELTYNTGLAPDIAGSWRGVGDPNLTTLAQYMRTAIASSAIADHQLAVIAHSMGGLVAQRALLDGLADQTAFLLLFGTPSGGLKIASKFAFWNRQVRGMAPDGDFVTGLRRDWDQRWKNERPFTFKATAGDRDQFVPPASSLNPFNPEDQEVVVGTHTEIVKPDDAGSLSFRLVAKTLLGEAAPGGPWSAARVAVERGDFRDAISALEPNAADLDDLHLVKLALALDSVGRRADAINFLRGPAKGTDARGVLAGRLKRDWQSMGRASDGQAALDLYRDAYDEAVAAGDASQAHYLGINVAFMLRAFKQDKPASDEVAREVITHAKAAPDDKWAMASHSEAHLYLGEYDKALHHYGKALEDSRLTPRELESMYGQAEYVAGEILGDEDLVDKLTALFRPAGGGVDGGG